MRNLVNPEFNSEVREHVRTFAEMATWGRERRVLEDVYVPAASAGVDG
jgi:hypothetical protein